MKGSDEAKPMITPRYREISPGATITRMCDGHGRPVLGQEGGKTIKRGGMRMWICRECVAKRGGV